MPTILTHAVAAGTLARAAGSHRLPSWTVPVAAVCAMLPDADVVAFSFGVPYDSILGHRGLTHSIAAAALLAAASSPPAAATLRPATAGRCGQSWPWLPSLMGCWIR